MGQDQGLGNSEAIIEYCLPHMDTVGAQHICLLEVLREVILDLMILGAFMGCLLYTRHGSRPLT